MDSNQNFSYENYNFRPNVWTPPCRRPAWQAWDGRQVLRLAPPIRCTGQPELVHWSRRMCRSPLIRCTGQPELVTSLRSAALVNQNGAPPPHPLHWSARSGHYCAKCLTGDTEWAAPPLISCTGQPELASTARNSALAMQNEPSTPSSAALVNQNWSLVREVLHWSRRMGRTSPHPLHWSAGIHLTASPSSLTCSLS